MTLRFLKPLTVAVSVALLTACAGKTATTTPAPALINHENSDPKTFLQNATSDRLQTAFAYRSDIYVANDIRQDALQDVSEKETCDSVHDKQYVAVLKRAKQDKLEISDELYKGDLKAIKQQYLACQKSESLARGSYTPFDLQGFYQSNKDLDETAKAQNFMATTEAHMASQVSDEAEDENHTPLQAKKAKLLDAYLLKPSALSVVGRYEPSLGRFTALPSVSYNSRNVNLSINQPISVDLKEGGIYLWADNFALANSQLLDKKLGDRWRNKWLFLPLNDGSLPADFSENLLKAYVQAKKESYLAKPASSFTWVDSKTFLDKAPFAKENLPLDTINTINQTPYIIESTISGKDKAYSDYVFYDVLYQTLTKKYPELTLESNFGSYQDSERDIVDGESVIHVTNRGNDDADAQTSPSENQPILSTNSKTLMILLLSQFRSQVDSYYATLGAPSSEADVPEAVSDATEQNKYAPMTHYGFSGGKLSWVHYRQYLTDQGMAGGQLARTAVSDKEPMFVDIFTKLSPAKSADNEFARLPATVQAPNAQNSVNLLDYKEEFLESLKSSDDKYLQLLMNLLMGSGAASAEAYPDDESMPGIELDDSGVSEAEK